MKKWLKTTISLLLAIIMIVGNAAIARAEGGYITNEPSDERWCWRLPRPTGSQ